MSDDLDMDLLVDGAPDDDQDFADGVNKETGEAQTVAEKNEAELNASGIPSSESWDVVAGMESFIQRNFGFSAEDVEEAAAEVVAEGSEIGEANLAAAAGTATSEDEELGITTPVAQTVTVVNPDGGETVVENPETDVDGGEIEETVIETPTDVQALENLRRIFSREDDEDDDGATVTVDVDNGTQDTSATFAGDAVTIEPNSGDDGDDYSDTSDDDGDAGVTEDDDDVADDGNEEEGAESWMDFL